MKPNRTIPINQYINNNSTATELGYRSTQENNFLYQGKERQPDAMDTDFDGTPDKRFLWYDFSARYYDAQLARWHVPDPADQHYSGYLAMGNNPVNNVDPTGIRDSNWGWLITSRRIERQLMYKRDQLYNEGLDNIYGRNGLDPINGWTVKWNTSPSGGKTLSHGADLFGYTGPGDYAYADVTQKQGGEATYFTVSQKKYMNIQSFSQYMRAFGYYFTGVSNRFNVNCNSASINNPGEESGGFYSDGIWTFGLTATASAGILLGSVEAGITLDFRSGFKIGGYATAEHASGADLSAGVILNYHKPTTNIIDFNISSLNGYAESWNGALWYIDGTYGGDSFNTGLNPEYYSDIHSIYNTYGFGISVGLPIGFTRNKGYTWTTSTLGW